MTGASFHYVDNGVDSGEVIRDVLTTEIDKDDTILDLRQCRDSGSGGLDVARSDLLREAAPRARRA